jgi:KipI family sensor histidine kinase inhibitor
MPLDAAKQHPHVSLLGTTAMLFEAPGPFDVATQQRIWSLARIAGDWPDIREAVPGMTNLLLTFEAPPRDPAMLEAMLLAAWDVAEPAPVGGTLLEIPVVYGGAFGFDLAAVAAHARLSVAEVVQIHTARTYTVFTVAGHPGYCYLGTVDPRIAIPRRKVPRLRVEAGSVSIGGMQTGVSASPGPSGWYTIGRTSVSFFDPAKEYPGLLSPGDTVRFRAARIES